VTNYNVLAQETSVGGNQHGLTHGWSVQVRVGDGVLNHH
jgi:hypothetical protein